MEGFAWPAAVVVLGFGFMLLFRSPVTALLGRTRKLGKSGLETFDSQQTLIPAEKPDPLAEFMGTYVNPLLREQEAEIENDLRERGLTDLSAANKALVRALAGTQLLLGFEKIQNTIWLSQVNLLTVLNSRSSTLEAARPLYEAASQQYAALYDSYSFESWLDYLESRGLIERNADAIFITTAGREFLKWRIEDGRVGPFHG